MMKSQIKFGDMFNSMKGVEVIIYSTEPSQDGTHISASCIFNADMLKRLSKNNIESLEKNLEGAIDACIKEVMRRKKLENET